jgi:hypothetical protein
MNFPAFDGLRVYEAYPAAVPNDGRFYACGQRHQVLICKPKIPDHELKGFREDVLNFGWMYNLAGACLILNGFVVGTVPFFVHWQQQARPDGTAAATAGPSAAELDLCAVETVPRATIKVLRRLALSEEFDAAVRRALLEMERADWPLSTFVQWWIDRESRNTPVELAAAATVRSPGRDIKLGDAREDK